MVEEARRGGRGMGRGRRRSRQEEKEEATVGRIREKGQEDTPRQAE